MTLVVVTVLSVFAEPLVLDNGAIRVELEPLLFSVRYVGISGGQNFVAPIPVDDEQLAGKDWLDSGGLQTDLIPFVEDDPVVRRGPAEVVEQQSDYIAIMAPPSEKSGMRLKKEIQLVGREARARFRVSALRVAEGKTTYALRNTMRLDASASLRLDKVYGEPKALAGGESIYPAVVKSRKYWIIPIPPTSHTSGLILGAYVPSVTIVNESGSWTRRITNLPRTRTDAPNDSTFLCVLDDDTRTYGASLQGAEQDLEKGAVVFLEEEWTFEKRGR